MITVESWRPVVGYEGAYEVSDLGRVRSLDRVIVDHIGRSRFYPGRILKVRVGNPPYPMVSLSRSGKTSGRQRVHVLIMRAFVGPAPSGMEIRHLDGDSLNCRLSNLAYGTSSENNYDLVRHGRHHLAKLTHCKMRGHEFTPENTFTTREGRRGCKRCLKIRNDNRPRKTAGGAA